MRLTNLNFIPTAPPIGGWRSLVLLLGVAALALSGTRWAAQSATDKALEAKLAHIQPPPAVKEVRSAAQQRELEAQSKVVGEAVRQLNLPLGDLIRTLQAPKDIRVALLGLDVSAKGGAASGAVNAAGGADAASGAGTATAPAANPGGVLKISGEARTAQEMMSYVAFLDEQPIFKSVYLAKHEISLGAGEPSYRFLLEAQWRQ